MTSAPPAPPDTDDEGERSKRLRKAYSEATTALRDECKDRFQELYVARARANGITDYNPKPSAEQKARDSLAALLKEHPDLREEVASGNL